MRPFQFFRAELRLRPAETCQPNRSAVKRIRGARRRGATAVEFALVAIPLFTFFFACLEFGRAMMAMESMEEAARAGCRAAVLDGATTDEVAAEVSDLLGVAGISDYTLTVTPNPPGSAEQWDPVTVKVKASFGAVTWIPVPQFLGDLPFSASCTLPREALINE